MERFKTLAAASVPGQTKLHKKESFYNVSLDILFLMSILVSETRLNTRSTAAFDTGSDGRERQLRHQREGRVPGNVFCVFHAHPEIVHGLGTLCQIVDFRLEQAILKF